MKENIAIALLRSVKKKRTLLNPLLAVVLCIAFSAATASAADPVREGLIEYIGAQKEIFKAGKATRVISLEALAGRAGVFAVGPVEGLDGEITIFDSKAYITKVRGADVVMDHSFRHGAFFLVWTEPRGWRKVAVPANVKGYVDLQLFVKAQAEAAGIDVTKPFPFLLEGTPPEIKWHINVDRTDGKPITQELFMKSKQKFVMKNEPVNIIGFYAEHHAGIFLPSHTPAFMEGTGAQNVIHIHLVAKNGESAGHIDNITLGEGMVLSLPKQ